MPNISTLVEDIKRVLLEPEFGETTQEGHPIGPDLVSLLGARLDPQNDAEEVPQERSTLRASNVGTPCDRKLWYKVNTPDKAEPLGASTRLKFLYGDILELLLLELSRKAGHLVTGTQTTMDLLGVKGHRDAVIDGMVVDVKSASKYSFKRFKEGLKREDDKFGYLDQILFYLIASQDDPLVTCKDSAAFLVVNKESGEICLDVHTFEPERDFPAFLEKLGQKIHMIERGDIPERGFEDEPHGTSGNRALCTECSYCDFKFTCWPDVQTFHYAAGPKFLTKVKKVPNVPSNF